jgi:hypothetical protein
MQSRHTARYTTCRRGMPRSNLSRKIERYEFVREA